MMVTVRKIDRDNNPPLNIDYKFPTAAHFALDNLHGNTMILYNFKDGDRVASFNHDAWDCIVIGDF
jgi:hypothetical protein